MSVQYAPKFEKMFLLDLKGTFSLDFGRTFLISANTASTCVNEKEKKTYSVDIRRLASANK